MIPLMGGAQRDEISGRLYETELRAAADGTPDLVARQKLERTAERVARDEDLDIEELLLLSVAAMAIQTPGEVLGWGRSVARRHRALGGAVEALLQSAMQRKPWQAQNSPGRPH